jgi:hypothetical protein
MIVALQVLVPVRVPERIKWTLEPLPLCPTPKQVGEGTARGKRIDVERQIGKEIRI